MSSKVNQKTYPVPGKRINFKQVQQTGTRESGSSQETAAAKGGFSSRSGRRIEKKEHQPKRERPHDWRTLC